MFLHPSIAYVSRIQWEDGAYTSLRGGGTEGRGLGSGACMSPGRSVMQWMNATRPLIRNWVRDKGLLERSRLLSWDKRRGSSPLLSLHHCGRLGWWVRLRISPFFGSCCIGVWFMCLAGASPWVSCVMRSWWWFSDVFAWVIKCIPLH